MPRDSRVFVGQVDLELSHSIEKIVDTDGCFVHILYMFIINEQETIVNKNDILWCFEHYEEKLEKSRRFDYQVDIEGESLKFEEAGAYLIGLDLSEILLLKTKESICLFLRQFNDLYCPPVNNLLRSSRFIGNEEKFVVR